MNLSSVGAQVSMPPGPGLSPGRQLLRYLRSPSRFFDQCLREHGEIFTAELGRGRRWVVVATPRLVRELFHADPSLFQAGEAKRSIFEPVVGTRSSLVLDGPEHLRRRKAIAPILAGERSSESNRALIALCREQVARWPRGVAFPAHERLQEIVFRGIFTNVFGPLTAIRAPLYAALKEMTSRVVGSRLLLMPALQWDLGPLSPWGRIRRIMAQVDRQVALAIEGGPPDSGGEILSGLLALRDASGQALSNREIRDELVTAIVAGHEITGISLAWALANFLSRPEIMARIRNELSEGIEGGLSYLEAAIKESLRMSSAVMIGSARKLRGDADFHRYRLPAGTMLVAYFHGLHRRPESFPEPERFIPERFLPEGFRGVKLDPYGWIPFGGGLRRCLGATLAIHQMKMVLATVLSEVRLELEGGMPEGVRRGAFFAPRGGTSVRCGIR